METTGERGRVGVPRGTPRSPQYGQGRTRAVPPLPQVLEGNGLPAPEPLTPGELAMLKRQHLVEFHTELQAPSRYKVGKEREEKHSLK